MRRFTIAGIGEILWDVLPDTEVLGGASSSTTWGNQSAAGVAGIARVTAL